MGVCPVARGGFCDDGCVSQARDQQRDIIVKGEGRCLEMPEARRFAAAGGRGRRLKKVSAKDDAGRGDAEA